MSGPLRDLGAWPVADPLTVPFLGSRQVIAAILHRHPDQVKRHGQPVACDVRTKAPLYDADQVDAVLKTRRRRTAA